MVPQLRHASAGSKIQSCEAEDDGLKGTTRTGGEIGIGSSLELSQYAEWRQGIGAV